MRYIANFGFDEMQGDREDEGSFQIPLNATDVEAAVASATSYLVELEHSRRSELFGPYFCSASLRQIRNCTP